MPAAGDVSPEEVRWRDTAEARAGSRTPQQLQQDVNQAVTAKLADMEELLRVSESCAGPARRCNQVAARVDRTARTGASSCVRAVAAAASHEQLTRSCILIHHAAVAACCCTCASVCKVYWAAARRRRPQAAAAAVHWPVQQQHWWPGGAWQGGVWEGSAATTATQRRQRRCVAARTPVASPLLASMPAPGQHCMHPPTAAPVAPAAPARSVWRCCGTANAGVRCSSSSAAAAARWFWVWCRLWAASGSKQQHGR